MVAKELEKKLLTRIEEGNKILAKMNRELASIVSDSLKYHKKIGKRQARLFSRGARLNVEFGKILKELSLA